MSTNKLHFIFAHQQARQLAAKACIESPDGFHCRITPPTRSLDQNARLWAMLSDVARSVVWHGRTLSADEWKCIFSAAIKRQDVVHGIDGGFVVMSQSTSQMTIKEMTDLQELITAFGVDHGVKFNEA